MVSCLRPIHKLARLMCSRGAEGAFDKWHHVSAPIHILDRRMCSRGAKGPFINGVMSAPRVHKSDHPYVLARGLTGRFINGVMRAPRFVSKLIVFVLHGAAKGPFS